MTGVKFLFENKTVNGFSISGHSTKDYSDTEGKLVCSAVSSAAIMTANTVTEIIGDKADIKLNDGEMYFRVDNPSKDTVNLLLGFKLHMTELAKQYSDNLRVYSEV